MVTRNETLPDARDMAEPEHGLLTTARQRSARTDPDMRDGDSGHGNPYESVGDELTSDNDVGDTRPTAAAPDTEDLTTDIPGPAAGSPEELEDTVDTEVPAVATTAGEGPAGASPDRQREFEQLRDEFKEEGRYAGREDEVAARIVNKQRREFGEMQEQQERQRRGESPDRDLPIHGYQKLTVPEVVRRADKLSPAEIRQVLDFEQHHRRRKTLVAQLERKLRAAGGRHAEK